MTTKPHGNEEVTAQAVFVHQAFQRAKPHDYHTPFEETNQEYQRVMRSIASELLAQEDAEVENARREERERITQAVKNYITNNPTKNEQLKTEFAHEILFVIEHFLTPPDQTDTNPTN